jgi:PPOX class probable F420-dependent enzyme
MVFSAKAGLGEMRPRYRAMKRAQLKIPIVARIKIKKARVARLATVDRKGHPHVVPICFAYRNGFFYTAVDLKPKQVPVKDLARVRNVRTTPQVALVLDEYRENWDRLWYVLVRGKARLIPESARKERAKAIRQLRAKYAQYAAGMLPDNAPIIRIAPERIAVWGRALDTAAR